MPMRDEAHPHRVDERALADAGDAGHADAPRCPGRGQEAREQRLRDGCVVVVAALDERDRLRQSGAVAAPYAALVRVEREPRTLAAHDRDSNRSSRSSAASAITVPGPKIATAPASRRGV